MWKNESVFIVVMLFLVLIVQVNMIERITSNAKDIKKILIFHESELDLKPWDGDELEPILEEKEK